MFISVFFCAAILLALAPGRGFSQIYLSGPVAGILEDTTYIVIADIVVQASTELIIEPGAELYFNSDCDFNIHGYLSAQGNEVDSVKFLRQNPDQPWGHIVFYNDSHDSSKMAYCLISGGYADPDNDWPYNCGGGVLCSYSSPTFEHCAIAGNQAGYCGGGMAIYLDSETVLNECSIMGNTADNDGGGMQIFSSSPHLINSVFASNLAAVVGGGISAGESSPIIDNCLFQYNDCSFGGGGFYCDRSYNLELKNSQFLYNNTDGSGGGMMLGEESSAITVDSCNVIGNTALQGGGIFCSIVTADISHCLITADSASGDGGGIAFYGAIINLENCAITHNFAGNSAGAAYLANNSRIHLLNSIIDNNFGMSGFFIDSTGNLILTYSDLYNNENGHFSGNFNPQLGQMVTVNANGDSCDVFYNIYLDPLYLDPLFGDFHLQETSPCIDAGDPASALDPDSTIADMGYYFYDQTVSVENPFLDLSPTTFDLLPCFPNPFNESLTIPFTLDQALPVKLKIYNQLGQLVSDFEFRISNLGENQVVWDASGQGSGVYYVRLMVDGRWQAVEKVVLLK